MALLSCKMHTGMVCVGERESGYPTPEGYGIRCVDGRGGRWKREWRYKFLATIVIHLENIESYRRQRGTRI